MLHLSKSERRRDILPEELSSWPLPEDSKHWSLRLNLVESKVEGPDECQLQATLLAALARPDIDTLSLHNASTTSPSQTSKDLMKTLLAQNRDWKVVYFSDRTSDLHLDLEWLELFQPGVRYLTFRWSHVGGGGGANVFPIAPMIAMLRAMPNLKELDFMRMCFPLSDFVLFYQDAFLAQRITRMGLILRPGDALFPTTPFLPNLTSFSLRVEAGTYPMVRSQCMKQVCQWKNLQRWTIRDTRTDDQAESFCHLSDSIRNPLCSLHELEIDLQCKHHKPEQIYMQQFIRAIGDNRSIRKLSLTLGTDSFFILSSLLPIILANKTNRIQHLGLLCFQVPRVPPGDDTPDFFAFLLDWQLQMRSIRFVRIGIAFLKRNHKISYVSHIHGRWQKWQEYIIVQQESLAVSTMGHEDEPTPSLTRVDRAFWANELERIDKTNHDPELACLSLDATYFLLQQWLSGISDVPPRL